MRKAQALASTHPTANRRSIAELEQELLRLKQKEKNYSSMANKLRELEEKSKVIRRGNNALASQSNENDEIDYIKGQIQKTTNDSKRLDEDNKLVKGQIKSLQNQLKMLNEAFSSISNQNMLQRKKIQLKDQQLIEKENELDQLRQRKNVNELVIEELRIDLTRLQGEEDELRRQLDKIKMERMEEERQKQTIRLNIQQIKSQIHLQEESGQTIKERLAQVRDANSLIKQELITLIDLEQKLQQQIQNALGRYQHTVEIEQQARHKQKLLEDELKIAEDDVKKLTDEYVRESGNLRQEQLRNEKLNGEMDMMAKEVFEVWQSIKEIMEINPQASHEVKIKCYQVWSEVSKILDLQ